MRHFFRKKTLKLNSRLIYKDFVLDIISNIWLYCTKKLICSALRLFSPDDCDFQTSDTSIHCPLLQPLEWWMKNRKELKRGQIEGETAERIRRDEVADRRGNVDKKQEGRGKEGAGDKESETLDAHELH